MGCGVSGELQDLEPKKLKKMDKGKAALVVIGFITLVVMWLTYKRSQANSAAAGTATGQASGVAMAPVAPTGTPPGSGVTPDWSGLQDAITTLTNSIASVQAPPPGTVAQTPHYSDVSSEHRAGSSYGNPTGLTANGIISTSAGFFESVVHGSESQTQKSTPLYVQYQPGQFSRYTGSPSKATRGTRFYTKVGTPGAGVPIASAPHPTTTS